MKRTLTSLALASAFSLTFVVSGCEDRDEGMGEEIEEMGEETEELGEETEDLAEETGEEFQE